MPRFHFDIFDGVQRYEEVAIDMEDVDRAKQELCRSTGEYLIDQSTRILSLGTWSIRLRDSDGRELAKLELRAITS
jgi:hypothetical protein